MTQSNDLFMYLFSMCAVDKLIVWLSVYVGVYRGD